MEGEFNEKQAAGMTVNERLWASGLMNDFDKAIADRNESNFREICKRVFLGDENADALVKKYFGD